LSDYLFLVNVGDEITNKIYLSKFIPNRRSKSNAEIKYKVGVYTQNIDSTKWNKIDEVKFNENNNIVLSSADYKLSVGQLAVIIPCAFDMNLNDKYDTLPKPISRKVDLSPVNERATISFTKGNAFSSYQGEFPYQMSRIKGTFLAFDSLMQDKNQAIRTKIVFINIHSNKLSDKKYFELIVANSDSKEKVASKKYVHNSACIIDIQAIDNVDLCFYSKDTLGIPIFISYNNTGYLSVEHTHPPSEYFWNNKFKGQQILKQNWLTQLL
jgi:hypothetical protein